MIAKLDYSRPQLLTASLEVRELEAPCWENSSGTNYTKECWTNPVVPGRPAVSGPRVSPFGLYQVKFQFDYNLTYPASLE